MILALSEHDRGVIQVMSNVVPWSGGEEGMLLRLEAECAVDLSGLESRGKDCPLGQLGIEASEYEVSGEEAEVLVSVLSGANSIPTEVGRPAAVLIGKIRAQFPKKAP